ncbi:hypothetical protein PHISCL_09581 [Aspergillus sclerotialis]|uniref:Uncharacterized protein n=1 Tax=Aspergillus sclerotialis TaxID=2070753 RepID=A0A3A2Z9W9_9EURO|nr:hypothetical protein PHISCL_09581 [Aspergillus sclerotialis]
MAPRHGGSHTASKTWVSDQAKEKEAFAKFTDSCVHIAPSSPFIPRTWQEWLKQRLWLKEKAYRDELRRLQEIERVQRRNMVTERAFSSKPMNDHRSSVLALETIWLPSLDPAPQRPRAPWPGIDELKYEGSYRGISGFCRFHPLPRVPGNTTAHWKQRSPLKPFSFDRVGSPSARWGEPAVDCDERMVFLVGESLMIELEK